MHGWTDGWVITGGMYIYIDRYATLTDDWIWILSVASQQWMEGIMDYYIIVHAEGSWKSERGLLKLWRRKRKDCLWCK